MCTFDMITRADHWEKEEKIVSLAARSGRLTKHTSLFFTKCFPSRLCSCALEAHDVMCIFPHSNVNLNRVQHFRERLSLSQSPVSSSQGLVWCRLECRWQNAPRKLPFASGHLINHDYHTIIIQSHTNRTCRVPSVVCVCVYTEYFLWRKVFKY